MRKAWHESLVQMIKNTGNWFEPGPENSKRELEPIVNCCESADLAALTAHTR